MGGQNIQEHFSFEVSLIVLTENEESASWKNSFTLLICDQPFTPGSLAKPSLFLPTRAARYRRTAGSDFPRAQKAIMLSGSNILYASKSRCLEDWSWPVTEDCSDTNAFVFQVFRKDVRGGLVRRGCKAPLMTVLDLRLKRARTERNSMSFR